MNDRRELTSEPRINPDVQQFIESMGVYFERYGLPRIGGRILGLLIVVDRHLSLDDMSRMLLVSRASISTNIRLAVALDLAELLTLPGDRRDYYRFADDAWRRGLVADIEGTVALRRLAERGLGALDPDDAVARERLDELADFCDFVLEERRGQVERWQARRRARQAKENG